MSINSQIAAVLSPNLMLSPNSESLKDDDNDKKNHKWTVGISIFIFLIYLLEENLLLINYLKPLYMDNDKTGDAEIFRELIKRSQRDGHLLNYNPENNY